MKTDWDANAIYFNFELSKEQLINLLEAFRLPKYLITEARFPKKKKRGTMRRKRKERKQLEQILIDALRIAPDKETQAILLETYIQEFGPVSDKNGEIVRQILMERSKTNDER